jgi:hypothetical protein
MVGECYNNNCKYSILQLAVLGTNKQKKKNDHGWGALIHVGDLPFLVSWSGSLRAGEVMMAMGDGRGMLQQQV